MYKKLSSFTAKSNQEISRIDLLGLRNTELLDTIVLSNIKFTNEVTFEDFNIGLNRELISINISGSEGIFIPDLTNLKKPIPLIWSKLTKLTTFNLQSCGFNQKDLSNLFIDFNNRVNEGLGSAILGVKTLTLNGQNAPLQISNLEVSSAKANLISKGWVINHN